METYKYNGSSVAGRGSGRLILDGSVSDPKRYVDVGGTIELDEDEAKELRGQGLKLTKTSEEPSSSADQEGENPPETREQQQAAQVASGAQHPAATEEKDNTPAGKSRQGK